MDIRGREVGRSVADDLGTVYRDVEALCLSDAVRDGALDRTRKFCDAPAYQALDRLRKRLALARQAELLAGALETGALMCGPALDTPGPAQEAELQELLEAFLRTADEARVVGG